MNITRPLTTSFLPAYLLLIIFLLSFTAIAKPTKHTTKSTTITKIDKVMNKILQENSYPGISLAIFLNGQTYHHRQQGLINIEQKKAADQDTQFRMYSVTKGLTMLLAAILVEHKLLDVNAPIGQYLPNLPEDKKQLTAQQLIDHKSGIRHYQGMGEWVALMQQHCENPNDAIKHFINDPLIDEPGKNEHYSSFAYVLLSAVMEASSGLTMNTLMDKYLFNKSQVERISFDDPTQLAQDDNTSLFYEPVNNVQKVAPAADNSCKFGAGNINASAFAISKIFSAFNEGKLSSIETVELLFPKTSAIDSSPAKASFGGEGLGGRSILHVYPNDNLVIVIAANARGGNLQPYANDIAEIILSQP